ncbi:MAG TPA: C40 family peptidase [Candidatus Erysipelatoclostridium merdavium]|uniref:C40 family peptidase n=1 Tax=Candidatus Erysipelatoclostridium merdavium TaxID=2838566 RepID=A0A9D1XL25_9FIRM|nr:C40 family peptidase [Candidatus Erysipelatoclostridium merdavium]
MKKNKIFIAVLSLSMLTSTMYLARPVTAVEFEGKESEYMNICSSANLSNSNKSTCEEFNQYLKNKNSELSSQLASQKEEASNTEDTLESIKAQLDDINNQISEKEAEITYLNTTISNLQANIEKNTQLLKDRMYAMQSYTNENTFINFIFGASNFTDMFSRIDSFNTLTQSDQDLIEELNAQKAQVEQQQVLLEETKAVLLAQQEEQLALQTKYTALLQEQNNAIAATQNSIYDYGEMTEELSAAIDEFNKNAYEIATPEPPKPSEVPTTPPSNNNDSGSNNGNTDSGSNGDNSNITTDLGQRIYGAAYSKLGSRYYWGASGPNYFDCSGFVYWSLNQAGVSVGRTTAAGYSRMWSSVSFANSQTGDLVCFGSPAYHIGIVIVNSNGTRSMIHAGGGNSSTFGDDPNACVKISSIEPGSYYYSRISTIRHIG